MDEVNVPQPSGDRGWPEAPAQAPGRGSGRAWPVAGRRLSRPARWTIGLGGAVALAGACALGVSVASSGGGSPQAARPGLTGTALTGAGARAMGSGSAGGSGTAAAAGSSGFAAGAPANGPRAGLHACVASARHLRAAGDRAAARAKRHACLRRYRRYLGAARARFARIALLVRRAMHGQITVATRNGPKTIAFERGTVKSVSGASIVVKAADGVTWTWHTGSGTRVFRLGNAANGAGGHGRQNVGVAALATGQRVAVGGLVSGGVDQARRILIRDSSPT